MKIRLDQVAKRYDRETIFKNLSFEFQSGKSYAVLGPNGSGKSTLLKVLSGFITPNRGEVKYCNYEGHAIPVEEIYRYIAIAAPYLEIMEELTLMEQVHFHGSFCPFLQGMTPQKIIEILELEGNEDKEIRNFSSGMKQRLKLALCILNEAPILLLDEPMMNLDKRGGEWFHSLINSYAGNRLIIVCSNREEEYSFCHEQLWITDYK